MRSIIFKIINTIFGVLWFIFKILLVAVPCALLSYHVVPFLTIYMALIIWCISCCAPGRNPRYVTRFLLLLVASGILGGVLNLINTP